MPRGIARGARDVVGVARDREDEIRGDFSASGGSGKSRKRSRGGSSSRGSDRVMEEGTKGGLDTKKTCLKSSARGGKHHDGDDKQESESGTLGDALVRVSRQLHDGLKGKRFRGTSKQAVTCSYNVLEYASATHEAYTRRYGGRSVGRALLVGMNPGPWGMVQTGVPFGEVGFVRDWLGISGEVGRPSKEHPKRPVDGFQCSRSEVSGTRLWGFFERRFGTAEAWGDRMFAYNYCPLTFMSASGGNITPDKLPPAERKVVDDACGAALADMISKLRPCVLVAVGNFAGARCSEALEASGLNAEGSGSSGEAVEVVVVNHPSPASPTGRKWETAACMNELRRHMLVHLSKDRRSVASSHCRHSNASLRNRRSGHST